MHPKGLFGVFLFLSLLALPVLAEEGGAAMAEEGFVPSLVQSFVIFFREGFEAALIIAAILAYITSENKPALKKYVYYGVGAGILASLFTAVAFEQFFAANAAAAELLEGVTMLLAAGVLLYTSHWLLSKASAMQWKRYIQGKVGTATRENNVLIIGAMAFLAVYREGFETVLFFKALFITAPDLPGILAGIVGAIVLLAVLFIAFLKTEKRLPVGTVFLTTGIILFFFAFAFAGKGVHELQEAHVLPETTLSVVPKLPYINTYPTLETTAVQAGVLLGGVLPIWLLRKKG